MSHIYPKVTKLENTTKTGDGDCVDLIKHYVLTLKNRGTFSWRPGEKVMTSQKLQPGTVIATFLCGKYPLGPNKHAAFFVGYLGPRSSDGTYRTILVMDQWKGKVDVSTRKIHSKGMSGASCTMTDNGVSNNLDTYYVVE